MVRLGTLVVTSLKPYRQRIHSNSEPISSLPWVCWQPWLPLPSRTKLRLVPPLDSFLLRARFAPTIEQAKQGRAAHLTGVITHFDPGKTGSRIHRLASPQRRGSILGRREQRSLHFFRRCCLWMFRLPTHRRSDSRAPTGVIEEHQLLDRSWVHFSIFA